MTLQALIDEHQTGDAEETVAAVFAAVDLPAKWRDFFYSVTRDECRRRARSMVRKIEAGGGDDRGVDETEGAFAATPSASHIHGFPIVGRFYDGAGYVPWIFATQKNHEGRIAFQSSLRGGIQADIDFHVAAIQLLNDLGVTCLDDLTERLAA